MPTAYKVENLVLDTSPLGKSFDLFSIKRFQCDPYQQLSRSLLRVRD